MVFNWTDVREESSSLLFWKMSLRSSRKVSGMLLLELARTSATSERTCWDEHVCEWTTRSVCVLAWQPKPRAFCTVQKGSSSVGTRLRLKKQEVLLSAGLQRLISRLSNVIPVIQSVISLCSAAAVMLYTYVYLTSVSSKACSSGSG